VGLPEMRARLRKDLHDEDPENYRWTDDELNRHIEHAVRELSLASPLECKATLTTTSGSRELSLSSLDGLVGIEAVEYPVGRYPKSYVRFSQWADKLTLLIEKTPDGEEDVHVYYGALHTLGQDSSTVPSMLDELVVMGASAYAAIEWSSYATNRVNVGGGDSTPAMSRTPPAHAPCPATAP